MTAAVFHVSCTASDDDDDDFTIMASNFQCQIGYPAVDGRFE